MHSKQPLLVVPIPIHFEKEYWGQKHNSGDNNKENEVEPKRRRWSSWVNTHRGEGQVVTETQTEYKEISDDSDFAGFNPGGSGNELKLTNFEGFPSLKNQTQSSPKAKGSKAKTSAAESSSSSDDDQEKGEKFAEDALKLHNELRKKHGVRSLKMSKKLCAHAQEWADQLAAQDRFEHRQNNDYGENLYCSWSSNPKATVAGEVPVQSWYSEMSKHTFGSEPSSMSSGHFTQIVWKASKEFGIAKAKSAGGKIIVVANYDPPGNFIGRYTENVLPPKES